MPEYLSALVTVCGDDAHFAIGYERLGEIDEHPVPLTDDRSCCQPASDAG
jgi:hypothetical protein